MLSPVLWAKAILPLVVAMVPIPATRPITNSHGSAAQGGSADMVGISSIVNCLARMISGAYRDRSGSVAIYVTVLMPFLIGGALLTVDAARLYSLNSFLQAGADAFALAGAAELDGRPDAITRADNAISNLVTNQMRLGDAGTSNITVSVKHYLSSIPSSDASAITSTNYTTDPAEARYVQITVTP